MEKIKIIATCAALASVSLLGLTHTSAGRAPPAPVHLRPPGIPYTGPAPQAGGGLLSLNWSGYEVRGGRYRSASANWTQPRVRGTGTLKMSSFWVGLDGWKSHTVEQTGTEAEIRNGVPVYYAWDEFYPRYQVAINAPVYPGDHLSASVTVKGGTYYTLKITDYTQGWTSITRSPHHGLANASAEVVAEATSSGGVTKPLANFGTVRFTNAKINGHAIGHAGATKLTMVDKAGRAKDRVSRLTRGGKNFTVSWKRGK